MKGMMIKKAGSIAVAATMLATSALAATESMSVSDQSKSTIDKIAENLKVQVLVNYYGPGIGSMDDRTPESSGSNAKTSNSTPAYLENQLRLAAKLSPGTSLGITNTLFLDTVGEHVADLQSPFIHFTKGNIVSSGGWTVGTDARFYLPMFRDGRVGSSDPYANSYRMRVSPYANYNIGRWTAGLGTYARYNVRDGKAIDSDTGAPLATDYIDLYAGPSIAYQLSPKVAVGILYEMNAKRAVNTNGNGWKNDGTDLEPNVSIDITPSLNINPYINLYTGNSVSTDTMMVGFYLTASLL